MIRPMSEEREEALDAAQRVIDAFAWAANYKPHRNRPERDAFHVARALLSTSSAERGMREALEKAAGELQKWLPTLSVHRSRQDCDHIRDVIAEARAALSPKGEGEGAIQPHPT